MSDAREVRTDIQGLRAIAVVLVLLFHIFPDRFAGGFVGVDVFFVISGYLITGHLLRAPPRRFGDIVQFWGRRLRRLLPASLLVIAATVVGASLILSATRLAAVGGDALASALYVENWRLAVSAVDYLALGVAPSPLQHYWSLGVEEQFYLVWPFVVGGLAWLAARARSRHAVVVGMGAFVAASLVVSVIWTGLEAGSAYFATPTRLWEFALGGLVAALPLAAVRVHRVPRALVAWAGIVLVLVSALVFDAETPFPGYLAAVPVVGTALVIAADSSRGWYSPGALLRLRPVQFVGNASYSLYLWHFPIIVFGVYLAGGTMTLLQKVPVVILSLVLAQLTKVFIEDPGRRSAWLRSPVWRTYAAAGLATVLVVGLSVVPTLQVQALTARDAALRGQVLEANDGCFGASALVTAGCAVTAGTAMTPTPTQARNDRTAAYDAGCLKDRPYAPAVACEFGDSTDPDVRVALVGNSHSAQWLPALEELAGDRSMAITTYLALGCMPTSARLALQGPAAIDGCSRWGDEVIDQTIAEDYDLVVISVGSVDDLEGVPHEDKFGPETAGYLSTLQRWAAAGIPVLVIRDTPIPSFNVADCVSANTADPESCGGSRAEWALPDAMVAATAEVPAADTVVADLNDNFCSTDECFPVIGGVLVYIDNLHFSATFSRTLAPYLAPYLDEALSRHAS